MEIYKALNRWNSFAALLSLRKGRFPKPKNGGKYVVEQSDDIKSMEKLEDFLNNNMHLDRLIKVKHSWVSPLDKGGDGKRFYEIEGIKGKVYEWRDFSETLELPNIKRRQTPGRSGSTNRKEQSAAKKRQDLTILFRKQFPQVRENIIRQMVDQEMTRHSVYE